MRGGGRSISGFARRSPGDILPWTVARSRERALPVHHLLAGAGILGCVLLFLAFAGERPGGGPGRGEGARGGTAPSAFARSGAPGTELVEAPGEISVRSLLREMVDLGAVARLPDPPYVARAASSYDRRSVSPASADGWFANDDWASPTRPNYVRVEERAGRREFVLMDVSGPGALVRIWSASPAGNVRFYFDGESTPELEVPFDALLTGKGPIPAPFAYIAAKGFNAYFPLPFRKGLKVTIDSLVGNNPWQAGTFERIYYHLSYRSYADALAPRVRTYRRAELPALLRDVRSDGSRVSRAVASLPAAGDHAIGTASRRVRCARAAHRTTRGRRGARTFAVRARDQRGRAPARERSLPLRRRDDRRGAARGLFRSWTKSRPVRFVAVYGPGGRHVALPVCDAVSGACRNRGARERGRRGSRDRGSRAVHRAKSSLSRSLPRARGRRESAAEGPSH